MWRPRDPETHVVSHKNGTWTVCSPCTKPPTLQPCIPTITQKKEKNKNNRRKEKRSENKVGGGATKSPLKQWSLFIKLEKKCQEIWHPWNFFKFQGNICILLVLRSVCVNLRINLNSFNRHITNTTISCVGSQGPGVYLRELRPQERVQPEWGGNTSQSTSTYTPQSYTTSNLEMPINLHYMPFRLWEEPGVPGGKTNQAQG